jgi:hypothetical protein
MRKQVEKEYLEKRDYESTSKRMEDRYMVSIWIYLNMLKIDFSF